MKTKKLILIKDALEAPLYLVFTDRHPAGSLATIQAADRLSFFEPGLTKVEVDVATVSLLFSLDDVLTVDDVARIYAN